MPLFSQPFEQAAADYLVDAWQRTILTWEVLRECGNQYLEHAQSGKPPVPVFDYEMIVDGRTLERPANYALVRIKPPADCLPIARGPRNCARSLGSHRLSPLNDPSGRLEHKGVLTRACYRYGNN